MDVKNYPFAKCLNPQKIKNQYTGQTMIVGCGKCCSCNSARSSSLSLKCNLESKDNDYSHFITLTYNQENIPLMEAVPVYGSKGTFYQFVSLCKRLDEDGLLLASVPYSNHEISLLKEKANLSGHFGYLSKYEIQLFLKRLRKNISKIYPNERIRYFACGEFGPKSLRPHYHLILWHNCKELSENLDNLVRESWQLGFTDTQKVHKSASSYVAGYVNSLGSLPRLYQSGQCKPFCCHSKFLGEKFFKSKKEEAYSLTPQEFMRRSFKNTSVDSEFTLWRSVAHYFYPKCRGYSSSDSILRKFHYTIFEKYLRRTRTIETEDKKKLILKLNPSPSEIANEIMYILDPKSPPYYDDYSVSDVLYYDRIYGITNLYKLAYELEGCTDPDQIYTLSEVKKMLESTYCKIAYDMRLSKHFLTFVCNSLHPIEIETKLKMIDIFWKDVEYNRMIDWYDSQNTTLEEFGLDTLPLFYDSCDIDLLTEHPFYLHYKSYSMMNADNRMKHKRQNDANRYWFRLNNL